MNDIDKRNIPTTKQFFLDKIFPSGQISQEDKELWLEINDLVQKCIDISLELTKLHVKAALGAAAKKVHVDTLSKNKNHRWVKMTGEFEFDPTNFDHKYVVNKKSILSAYPETLIK